MIRRIGVLSYAGALLASASVVVMTLGMSAANAANFEDWDTVSAGGYHTCGIRHGGRLYCWGIDHSGQVGDGGSNTRSLSPERIGSFEDWATVSGGQNHTCGVRDSGKLYCWGNDGSGQVGDGDANSATAPRRIGSHEDWATVSAGDYHTCGIRHGGQLYCWGDNQCGQVGDGTAVSDPCREGFEDHKARSPRRIGTFEDWANVSAGGFHTCGVRKNGKLYCWGNDDAGQVGDGDADPGAVTAPLRIGTFEDWANVSAGGFHTCGVRKNGKLYCWGNDENGQVGDGEAGSPALAPRRIGTFEDWARATAGWEHACGIRHGGKLYCWGKDDDGQVGDGDDPNPATAPRRIGTFEDWAAIDGGVRHSCGVRTNGKLYCWGSDHDSQLGDGEGDSSPVTSPRRI
jgi:alpha-tubulin suppressor-like RCC1 family protein